MRSHPVTLLPPFWLTGSLISPGRPPSSGAVQSLGVQISSGPLHRRAAEGNRGRTQAAGAIVQEVRIPWTRRVFKAGAAHYADFPGYPDPETMSPEDRARLSAPAREYQAYMRRLPRLRLEEADAVRMSMYWDLANLFGRYRALVTPTTAVPSVPADLPIEGAIRAINGKAVDPVWDWCLTYPFNMLGHVPSASVPSGFSSSGVPTGLQIVGAPYDEAGVLRIASSLERVRPWLGVSERPLR